jgi:hypothetical protein
MVISADGHLCRWSDSTSHGTGHRQVPNPTLHSPRFMIHPPPVILYLSRLGTSVSCIPVFSIVDDTPISFSIPSSSLSDTRSGAWPNSKSISSSVFILVSRKKKNITGNDTQRSAGKAKSAQLSSILGRGKKLTPRHKDEITPPFQSIQCDGRHLIPQGTNSPISDRDSKRITLAANLHRHDLRHVHPREHESHFCIFKEALTSCRAQKTLKR